MEKRIKMAHGAGGKSMDQLIKEKMLRNFTVENSLEDVPLSALDDSAVIEDVVFTTDSATLKPLFFPGGDIGSLSVSASINDICMLGAKPIALSAAFIVEEGFSLQKFGRIVKSMGKCAKSAGVPIVTGDTKVVEKGAIQEFMINTSGIGKRSKLLENNLEEVRKYRDFKKKWLLDSNLESGDKIIISGNIGEHGIALLSSREGYSFDTKVKSDVAPVNSLMEKALATGGIVAAKDPTRGGLSNALNEWSEKSSIGILVKEKKIPIPLGVSAACEMLGIDPLDMANEGKVIFGVVKKKAKDLLDALKKHPLGKNAEIIGEATDTIEGVVLETKIGGKRILPKPIADPIPRIC